MIKTLTYLLALSLFVYISSAYASPKVIENKSEISTKDYEAIVIGKMISKKVKKSDRYYYTEYKLKPKEWLFAQPKTKKYDALKIRILGAELPDKGIVIKASCAPDYVPMNKEAIFLLERTRKKNKDDVFTISKGGIILDIKNQLLFKKEI